MKKKETKVKSVKTTSPTTGTPIQEVQVELLGCKPKIEKLGLEFGREDLNSLRDKVNELIDKQNEC